MGLLFRFSCWNIAVQLCCITSLAQPPELLEPSPAVDQPFDVLTRGPVHEAFAEQVNADPVAGIVLANQPPSTVNEIPPEVKPEGTDVTWISGYWFWDDDRNDFVWVSGIWRRVPPDRRWVPGYWQDVAGGYQWVAGFWAAASTSALEYLDTPPPKTLEAGPSSPALSDQDFWVPGSWLVYANDYSWRPGYWHACQDNWTWVGSRFVWTPRGCVYVSGYWDYSLSRRGCLFAPVHFRRAAYLQPGYRYRPSCWIGSQSLLLHLFIRPHRHHYYFGDYYAPIYRHRRYYACHSYYRSHRGFDPLYTYYQHRYRRQGIDYVKRVHDWHHYYAQHPVHRPAHTWAAQQQHQRHHPGRTNGGKRIASYELGRSWSRDARDRTVGLALIHTNSNSRATTRLHTRHVQDLAELRRKTEVAASKRRVQSRRAGNKPGPRITQLGLPHNPSRPKELQLPTRRLFEAESKLTKANPPTRQRGRPSPATKRTTVSKPRSSTPLFTRPNNARPSRTVPMGKRTASSPATRKPPAALTNRRSKISNPVTRPPATRHAPRAQTKTPRATLPFASTPRSRAATATRPPRVSRPVPSRSSKPSRAVPMGRRTARSPAMGRSPTEAGKERGRH